MGKPTVGMLLMMFYYLVVRMPWEWIFSKIFLGLNGVWLAVLISHIVACISAVLYCIIYKKKNKYQDITS
jgi:Na+-driven multidrug efflux pump